MIRLVIAVGIMVLLIGCIQPGEDPSRPVLPKDACSSFDAQQCAQNENCKPVYGPSSCSFDWLGGGACTEDIQYKGCRLLTSQETKKERLSQLSCESTHGVWSVDSTYKIGSCACPMSTQETIAGCLSLIEQCRYVGGQMEYKPSSISLDPNEGICRCSNGKYLQDYYLTCGLSSEYLNVK
jgi:hypothetical protein